MLSTLLIVPILGIITILMITDTKKLRLEKTEGKRESEGKKEENQIKIIGLSTSIINFIISIILWSKYDSSSDQFQFVQEFNQLNFCHLNLGIDGISIYFILLTTFLIPIVLLSNWDSIKNAVKTYVIIILLLETLMLAVFMVLDVLLFYIFFESILPPLFLLIGLYGSTRKIRASFHLFLYTLLGSLFMLLAFLTMYFLSGSTDFNILYQTNFNTDLQKILWIAIFISIMVKTPLFPFHIWLPLAHAESPLGGSILLAGIVLKLALYGCLRILLPILPEASLYFTPLVYVICVITILYTSLTTLRQIDIKVIIAYSSIGHMGVTLMGAFSNTIQGIEGSILLGLAHGLISPALFIIAGGVLYDRYHTRVLTYYRGLTQTMPLLSLMFFLSALANMATPLFGNFVGEFLSMSGAFQRSPILAALGATGIVLSAAYTIWLYNRLMGGSHSPYLEVMPDLTRREFYILLPLISLTLVMGIVPNFILEGLHYSVSTLIYSI